MHYSTIIVGDFNTQLIIIEQLDLRNRSLNSINQLDLTDMDTLHNNRIHIPLKCKWDIFQGRTYVKPQIKSQKI